MRSQIVRAALSSSAAKCYTPIPVFGITGNYAQAMYSAASKKGAQVAVSKDLGKLNDALSNDTISGFMQDPFTESAKKLNILGDVAKKQNMSPLVVNLFSVLADNHRLNLIGDICSVYDRIVQAEAGFTPVTVTSASALSKAQQKEVAAAVEAIVGKGGKVEIDSKVDGGIVGGLVISIGDKYTEMNHIDLSTSSKLKKYKAILKAGI